MKLLAASISSDHDWNMSYFDGNTVKYHKFERAKQIKRFGYDNNWEWINDVKQVFGVNLDEIDQLAIEFDAFTFFDIPPTEFFDVYNGDILSFKLGDDINPFKKYGINDVTYVSHHYSHALSSWMLEEKEPSVRFVIDGLGDKRTWTVYKDNKVIDKGFQAKGSIGFGMRDAGMWIGVKYQTEDDIAGKVMGLQSYGCQDKEFLKILNSYNIDQINEIFSTKIWSDYIGDELLAILKPLDWIHTVHERVGNLLLELFSKHASENDVISYSGGVAQNVIWNTLLRDKFKNLIIPPHAADEGLSLGVIEFMRKQNNLPRFIIENFPYSQTDVAPKDNPTPETIQIAAKLLSEGKIVGWYQGNGEVGPRALGNRSILMDPRIFDGKKKINLVKKRENYRPFGASILSEFLKDYFETAIDDKFMLFTDKPKTKEYPAITHVDGTCRVQSVENLNPNFRLLLEAFYSITGCPMVLNTSLNLAGKPIAAYPENAIDFFYNTEIDAMVIGNKILIKENLVNE